MEERSNNQTLPVWRILSVTKNGKDYLKLFYDPHFYIDLFLLLSVAVLYLIDDIKKI